MPCNKSVCDHACAFLKGSHCRAEHITCEVSDDSSSRAFLPAPTDHSAVSSPQMTEGRHCQVHLLDDRRLELLVQVGVARPGQHIWAPCEFMACVRLAVHLCSKPVTQG